METPVPLTITQDDTGSYVVAAPDDPKLRCTNLAFEEMLAVVIAHFVSGHRLAQYQHWLRTNGR